MTSSSIVWCIVIDHKRAPLGDLFKVKDEVNVADLREAVKRENPADVGDRIDPTDLIVMKCPGTAVFFDPQSTENMDEQVRSALSLGYRRLSPMETIVDLELGEKEALIVQLPGGLFVPIPQN